MSKKAYSWKVSTASDTTWTNQAVEVEEGSETVQPRSVTVENISDVPIQVKLIEDSKKSNNADARTGTIIAAGAQKTFTVVGSEKPIAKVGVKLLTGETGSISVYVNAIDYVQKPRVA